jgi:hypothetical protein
MLFGRSKAIVGGYDRLLGFGSGLEDGSAVGYELRGSHY